MQPISFTAPSAEAAVAQIRAKLGPNAVVLNVRPLPANGLARLWQKPMIEVLAHVPEESPLPSANMDSAPITELINEFRQQLADIRQQVDKPAPVPEGMLTSAPAKSIEMAPLPQLAPLPDRTIAAPAPMITNSSWKVAVVLEKSGLLPLAVQRVLDELTAVHGDTPPHSLAEEIALTRQVLSKLWRNPIPMPRKGMHVLVGSAGSGKTTCLCKWLTQTILMEGRTARVWRLDGATANMAESLSVYTEILGATCERTWQSPSGGATITEDAGFIDLPGVDYRKPLAVKELVGHIKQLGAPQIHLVLNGAYDISILLEQVRAFSALPIADLIVTHLDEESRWGKLWNLALGTNYSIRYLSTGQNIPGDFREASAELILNRQFPRK